MPEDAVGVDRMTAPPQVATPAPAPEASTQVTEQTGVIDGGAARSASRVSRRCPADCSAPACSPPPHWPRSPSSGAAGSVPASDAEDVEAELRGAATPSRAAFLDRALRDLMAACREASAPLPPVYAVLLDDDSVTLRLAPSAPDPGRGVAHLRRRRPPGSATTSSRPATSSRRPRRTPPWSASASTTRAATRSSTSRRPVAWSPSTATPTSPARSPRRSRCRAAPPRGRPTCASPPPGMPGGLAGIGDDRIRIVHRPRDRRSTCSSRGSRRSAPTCSPAGWSSCVAAARSSSSSGPRRRRGRRPAGRPDRSRASVAGRRAGRQPPRGPLDAARRQQRAPAPGRARHHRDGQPHRPRAGRGHRRAVRGRAPARQPGRRWPGPHPGAAAQGRRRRVDDRPSPGRRARDDRRHRRSRRRRGPLATSSSSWSPTSR